jgi:hypothetical protein
VLKICVVAVAIAILCACTGSRSHAAREPAAQSSPAPSASSFPSLQSTDADLPGTVVLSLSKAGPGAITLKTPLPAGTKSIGFHVVCDGNGRFEVDSSRGFIFAAVGCEVGDEFGADVPLTNFDLKTLRVATAAGNRWTLLALAH